MMTVAPRAIRVRRRAFMWARSYRDATSAHTGPGLGSTPCEPDRDAARLASRSGRPDVLDAVVGRHPVDFGRAPDPRTTARCVPTRARFVRSPARA